MKKNNDKVHKNTIICVNLNNLKVKYYNKFEILFGDLNTTYKKRSHLSSF